MNKLIYSNANEELAKVGPLVTLIDSERSIKQATSSAVSNEIISHYKPDKDHFMVHYIGLGDYETYSFNKNGDAFTKHANENYHHTFLNGHYFREHNNSDPKHAIGQVKAAFYNPDMNRVEIIVWGHKKKAAEELERIKSGKSASCSMSCKVAYDVSSITGKKAATRFDYDDYCKYRLGQWIPEHKKFAFVFNPEPDFFDLSDVKRPADRIAHELFHDLGTDELEKAASEFNGVIPSSRLAELAGILSDEKGCAGYTRNLLLKEAAKQEAYIRAVRAGEDIARDEKYHFTKQAAFNAFSSTGELTDAQIEALARLEPGAMVRSLTKRATCLPFKSFCAYVTGKSMKEIQNDPVVKYAMDKEIPLMFEKLLTTPLMEMEKMFDPCSEFELSSDPNNDDEVQNFMDEVAKNHSIEAEPMRSRVMTITIQKSASNKNQDIVNNTVDNLSENEKNEAIRLVQAYGHYKLASMEAMNKFKGNNYIDTPKLLTLISQNHI